MKTCKWLAVYLSIILLVVACSPDKIQPVIAISPANAGGVKQLARLGKEGSEEVAWSPDGRQLVVATSKGIYLYDPETLEQKGIIDPGDFVWSVAFSLDGRNLASSTHASSTGSSIPADYRVKLWDASSGRLLNTFEGSTMFVTSVAFSPNGWMLASGAGDGTTRLWGIP